MLFEKGLAIRSTNTQLFEKESAIQSTKTHPVLFSVPDGKKKDLEILEKWLERSLPDGIVQSGIVWFSLPDSTVLSRIPRLPQNAPGTPSFREM